VSTTEASDLAPVAPPPSRARARRRSVVVLALVAAGVLALISQGLLHSLNYFETVDEALANRASLGTSVIRLEGVVAAHSIERTSSGTAFTLRGGDGRRVVVRASGSPPQLFQANIPVVVAGHFASAHSLTFLGTQILVKHTSSYIAAHPHRVRAPNGTTR
jgi:cytochrome c-type biogenesis protein CcmE